MTKARHVYDDTAKPFEARLTTIDDKFEWEIRDVVDDCLEQACALFEQGIGVRKVASELGISKSRAGRLRQRLVEEGWLNDEAKPDNDENT